MRTVISSVCLTLGVLALSVSLSWGANCVTGGCHEPLLGQKFLHGPVAAEEAGVEGCVSCHVPAGKPCSASKAGTYKFKTQKDRLCLMCHDRGTGTQHTRTKGRCLSCHDPHGSEKSGNMMRAG